MKRLFTMTYVATIVGTLIAADVPWQFTGDDTRTGASTVTSATHVSPFATGIQTPCVVSATLNGAFRSQRGLIIIFR